MRKNKVKDDINAEDSIVSSKSDYIKISKFWDYLFDTLPYGWRIHRKCCDIRRWCIRTYQRMRSGVSDEECWSLDNTFTNFILPRLKHFKKMERHTYPSDITPEQWEKILDELIWTFEYMTDGGESINPFPDLRKNGEELLSYLNREKTDEEKQIMDKWFIKNIELNNRKQRGLELFAKYYHNLWD